MGKVCKNKAGRPLEAKNVKLSKKFLTKTVNLSKKVLTNRSGLVEFRVQIQITAGEVMKAFRAHLFIKPDLRESLYVTALLTKEQ